MHVVGDATETSDGGQRTDDQLDDRHTQGRVTLAVQTPAHVQLHTHTARLFTARRHAGAVYATALCPSVSASVCLPVCLSQVGVLLKRLNIGSGHRRSFWRGGSCGDGYPPNP